MLETLLWVLELLRCGVPCQGAESGLVLLLPCLPLALGRKVVFLYQRERADVFFTSNPYCQERC